MAYRRGLGLVTAAMLSLAAGLQAHQAEPPIAGPRMALARGERPDIAIDDEGILHVVYADAGVRYVRVTPDGPGKPIAIDTKGTRPRIALDGEGRPHAVYFVVSGSRQTRFYYTRWADTGFLPPMLVREADTRSEKPRIAVDARTGRAVVSYEVIYGKDPGQSWRVYFHEIDNSQEKPSIGPAIPISSKPNDKATATCECNGNVQIADDGTACFVWRDWADKKGRGIHFRTYGGGGRFGEDRVLTPWASDFTDLAFDGNGSLHVIGTTGYATEGLFYARCSSGRWQTATGLAKEQMRDFDPDHNVPCVVCDRRSAARYIFFAAGPTERTHKIDSVRAYVLRIDNKNRPGRPEPLSARECSQSQKYDGPRAAAAAGGGAFAVWTERSSARARGEIQLGTIAGARVGKGDRSVSLGKFEKLRPSAGSSAVPDPSPAKKPPARETRATAHARLAAASAKHDSSSVEHPRLFVKAAEVELIRRCVREGRQPWRRQAEEVEKAAAEYLRGAPRPWDGRVPTGWKANDDSCGDDYRRFRDLVNSESSKIATIACAYLADGRADRARAIRAHLLSWATKVAAPAHEGYWNKSIRIDMLVLPMMFAYDLAYNADCWRPGEREKVDAWLEAMVQFIRWCHEHTARRGNIKNWDNAAMALYGFLVSDGQWARYAIDSEQNAHKENPAHTMHFKAMIAADINTFGETSDRNRGANACYYQCMSLNALALVALAAENARYKEDLWQYTAPNGRSLRMVFDFLAPMFREGSAAVLKGDGTAGYANVGNWERFAGLPELAYRGYRDEISRTVLTSPKHLRLCPSSKRHSRIVRYPLIVYGVFGLPGRREGAAERKSP